jgi:predicted aldo/keto reductase-like oxidoreductase
MILLDLLPNYFTDNTTIVKLEEVLSSDINKMKEDFQSMLDECFVKSSTQLLSRYEKMHGINVDVFKSVETRRSKIMAKMAGTGTFTKAMLINSIKAFPGGNAAILEDNPNYKFTIKFNDYYRIPDTISIQEIYAITNELKPAHLAYDHTFTYDYWGNLNGKITWSEATTWEALRTY